MTKKLVIFGGSGIGMIAASVAQDIRDYTVTGFLNDVIPVGSRIGKYQRIPVVGETQDYRTFLDDPGTDFFVAYVGMQNEERVFQRLVDFDIPRERYATLIHPTAIIPRGMCHIGSGCLLAPLSQLSPDTTIADNCILLANSFVGHDSELERFAHLATNAVVGANVRVGKAVHVGSNATIREKITIGDFALIGSGSVVLNSVESNSIVAGNPARLLRMK